MIEKTLEEIIWYAANDDNELGRFTVEDIKLIAQAILTSPDIAVVEKDKLQKMQRVVDAVKRTIAWSQVEDDKLEQALADLEG